MATRVTLTALPCTLNAQMGAVAGPRVVWIGPDVSWASVRRITWQSEQGASVLELIAPTACCAAMSGTFVDAPSCHVTVPSGGTSSDSSLVVATFPAMSERVLLSPTDASQSPI
jgi:hypothetical protein